MDFATNLLNLRDSIGKTRKQMADEIGVSLSAYTNYEAGNRAPKLEIVPKIAAALNVSIDELLKFTPDKTAYWIAYLRNHDYIVVDDGKKVKITIGEEITTELEYDDFVAIMNRIDKESDELVSEVREGIFNLKVRDTLRMLS